MTALRCQSAAKGLGTLPPVQRFTQASAVSKPSSICEASDASCQSALADAGGVVLVRPTCSGGSGGPSFSGSFAALLRHPFLA